MKSGGSSISDIQASLVEAREADRRRIKVLSDQAGGPAQFVRATYSRLSSIASSSTFSALSESALSELTEAHLDGAERRLGQCAVCPEGGGACATDVENALLPGIKPRWEAAQLVSDRCTKWKEFKIRERLVGCGVEPRFVDCTFAKLDPILHLKSEAKKALRDLGRAVVGEGDGTLIVTGRARSGATDVSVALMRSILVNRWTVPMRFVSVRRLNREKVMTALGGRPIEDVLERAVEVRFTVFDGVDLLSNVLTEELRKALYERWTFKRPTLITTPLDAGVVISTLHLAGDVAVCNLTNNDE